MSSVGGSSALVYIKVINWCGRKGHVVLNVTSEEFDWRSNFAEKVFAWMGFGGLVGGRSNLELLSEFH